MGEDLLYQILADVTLALHVAVVVFVVWGLVLVFVGNLCHWQWVNIFWFRLVHLGSIAVVVAEALLGATCPLTTLEMWLRTKVYATTYSGSFIEYWFQRALYYEAPSWIFTLGYSLFGLLVLATWWYLPPDSKHRSKETDT